MRRTSFESMNCPVARAIDVLGDSWNVLILREAFYGRSRFDEFVAELGIPSNTLTRRLQEMVDGGLLEKRLYSERPPRYQYLLTTKGRDLRPVLLALLAWGNKHATPRQQPVRLIDTETGEQVELSLVDARTGKAIGPQHKVLRQSARPVKVEMFDFDGESAAAEA
ncbi:helix-turn-helix domain-containing protein [Pelomonas sp. KK5]|uniref:winged helix-turn-helix transcriptional regulator n=1 Tax=Pelomonas sp. KK5 TaxID=1855730 RepID=UPI00097CB22E|nr:helix-turn-helix domain-containing protein [Pelomonas sp. KK5]